MMLFAVLFAIFSYVVVRLLALTDLAAKPTLVFMEGYAMTEDILARCPTLFEPYVPTLMFGKNGHLQTLLYGLLGRIHTVVPSERHETTVLKDGTPITFDIFKPKYADDEEDTADITMVVCPGIANTSDSLYLRTFANLATDNGYRVAVLNHLGVLPGETLVTPRIFSYGDTDEYSAMVKKVKEMYPSTKLVAVGFSMGANIITKYLGEAVHHRDGFVCGVSMCQGYDAARAMGIVSTMSGLSKVYYFVIGQRMKRLIWTHRAMLLTKQEDFNRVMTARYLWEIDEAFTKRQHNCETVEELYNWCSCSHHVHKIDIPMMLLNAADDPLVDFELCKLGQSFARENENFIHVLTKHGGHLGFFEGGVVVPNKVTWMDRSVIEYVNAVCHIKDHKPIPTASS